MGLMQDTPPSPPMPYENLFPHLDTSFPASPSPQRHNVPEGNRIGLQDTVMQEAQTPTKAHRGDVNSTKQPKIGIQHGNSNAAQPTSDDASREEVKEYWYQEGIRMLQDCKDKDQAQRTFKVVGQWPRSMRSPSVKLCGCDSLETRGKKKMRPHYQSTRVTLQHDAVRVHVFYCDKDHPDQVVVMRMGDHNEFAFDEFDYVIEFASWLWAMDLPSHCPFPVRVCRVSIAKVCFCGYQCIS